ncbi:MAG TPA: Spy/CpxP family protein refolding chaperone [Bordetella sp.]
MQRTLLTPWPRTAIAFAVILLLGTAAALSNPVHAASPTTHAMPVTAASSVDTRINSLHSRLQITATQEPLWQSIAQVMRDNAAALDALRQSRTADKSNMNAVDNLRAYGEAIDAHADGIKKLETPFEALYASMSDAQKRNADLIFRDENHMMKKKG